MSMTIVRTSASFVKASDTLRTACGHVSFKFPFAHHSKGEITELQCSKAPHTKRLYGIEQAGVCMRKGQAHEGSRL